MNEEEKGRFILNHCKAVCSKYLYTFSAEDVQDMVSQILLNIYKYIPATFESDLHFYRWARLYIGRFAKNEFRNFSARRNKNIKTQNIWFDEIGWYENLIVRDDTAKKNYEAARLEVKNFLETLPKDQKFKIACEKLLGKDIPKKFGMTRRNGCYIARNFKKKIKENCLK